jgi:hypothetical protein
MGATEPAAPGPPWMTTTRKGTLPYFLNVSICAFFLQEFLNYSCFESGCIVFSHHALSISYFSLFLCLD